MSTEDFIKKSTPEFIFRIDPVICFQISGRCPHNNGAHNGIISMTVQPNDPCSIPAAAARNEIVIKF